MKPEEKRTVMHLGHSHQIGIKILFHRLDMTKIILKMRKTRKTMQPSTILWNCLLPAALPPKFIFQNIPSAPNSPFFVSPNTRTFNFLEPSPAPPSPLSPFFLGPMVQYSPLFQDPLSVLAKFNISITTWEKNWIIIKDFNIQKVFTLIISSLEYKTTSGIEDRHEIHKYCGCSHTSLL